MTKLAMLTTTAALAIATTWNTGVVAQSRVVSALAQVHLPTIVLYNQMSGQTNNTVDSQNFSSTMSPSNDAAADDFVVPASGWHVTEVDVLGSYTSSGGQPTSVDIFFYRNRPANGQMPYSHPGKVVRNGAYTNVICGDISTGNFTCVLPRPKNFRLGTYWLSVVPNCNFTRCGYWGWTTRTPAVNDVAVWQKPGGGFGLRACTTWNTLQDCFGSTYASNDLAFELKGASL
jgi:hypothetical protein